MTIRYIIVADDTQIFSVTNMYDKNAMSTDDPHLATAIVIAIDGDWQALKLTDENLIHTVH